MIADLVIDFENQLKTGHVYLVELELPWQDSPDEAPSSITTDLYLIARDHEQAKYIAHTMYPDATIISSGVEPVDEFTYISRRNRSILQRSQRHNQVC